MSDITLPRDSGYKVPERMIVALEQYVNMRRPIGGFLTAVLENNLGDASAKADSFNKPLLADYAAFIYNYLPSKSWGSRVRVWAWLNGKEKDHPAEEKLRNFAMQIARMTMDGDEVDGKEFVMENDDAVSTVNELIDSARDLVGGKPIGASDTSWHSVLLLYPDHIATNYGQETYFTSVQAKTVREAISKAQDEVVANHVTEDSAPDPDDFFVLLVLKGKHDDLPVEDL